ncbi:hypothetical protein BJ986_000195 [Phycicoccus badiiscoriae]|uniref:Uncharacterized protein n=1 Tax=Pedococcus badiiscoriae TaxID=642776 RepID=A0A852W9F4_9MICO|nr:hypothetical protein [Pedococcus badiiscoriae]NYG05708.1 hypothetical protein [Pedococcus badiiscoriae]
MSFKIADLRRATDEVDLVRLHDEVAPHTMVGVDYYLEELQRRDFVRAAESSEKLARAAAWLSVVSAAASVLALLVSVIALFR